MTSHPQDSFPVVPNPNVLPSEQEVLVSEDFRVAAEGLVTRLKNRIATGEGNLPPIVQAEGHSEAAEAERDFFLNRLSSEFGGNVDEAMTAAEVAWKAEGNAAVVVLPWMKRVLHMNDAESTSVVPGVERKVLLHNENGTGYVINELEIPNKIMDTSGVRDRVNRVIFFSYLQILPADSPKE